MKCHFMNGTEIFTIEIKYKIKSYFTLTMKTATIPRKIAVCVKEIKNCYYSYHEYCTHIYTFIKKKLILRNIYKGSRTISLSFLVNCR